MRPVQATVFCRSLSPHLTQALTGLALLHRAGIIGLRQVFMASGKPDARASAYGPQAHEAHLLLRLEDGRLLYYDMQDADDINAIAAEQVHSYFKRSYSQSAIPLSLQAKIQAYGLNYTVYADGRDPFEIGRRLFFEKDAARRMKALVRLVSSGFAMAAVAPGFRATVREMSGPPEPDRAPRVLFMARAWDPKDDPARPVEKQEQRHTINELRAQCVRRLRKEFGAAFTGGFRHTPYALEHYRDVLLADDRLSTKENYIRLLRDHPIGVATTGLHESIGWKFAEYIAFAKAIVAERLNYEVPGDLQAGTHYLEFNTPTACVARCVQLFEDRALREAMMRHNRRYYETWMRPDKLMLRTLRIAAPDSFAPEMLPSQP